jgi:hypothetical protein
VRSENIPSDCKGNEDDDIKYKYPITGGHVERNGDGPETTVLGTTMSALSCLRYFAKNTLKPSRARLGAYYSIKHLNSSAWTKKTSGLSLLSAPLNRYVPVSINHSSAHSVASVKHFTHIL